MIVLIKIVLHIHLHQIGLIVVQHKLLIYMHVLDILMKVLHVILI